MQKYAQDQVLVYGATTFRAFREFVADYDEPYYESLNALLEDRVLEHPAGAARWSNSTVISEGCRARAMARLKRETDKPMRSHGSISLNRALLAAGLLDFLEVTVFPVITGRAGYAALFQDGPEFDLESRRVDRARRTHAEARVRSESAHRHS